MVCVALLPQGDDDVTECAWNASKPGGMVEVRQSYNRKQAKFNTILDDVGHQVNSAFVVCQSQSLLQIYPSPVAP